MSRDCLVCAEGPADALEVAGTWVATALWPGAAPPGAGSATLGTAVGRQMPTTQVCVPEAAVEEEPPPAVPEEEPPLVALDEEVVEVPRLDTGRVTGSWTGSAPVELAEELVVVDDVPIFLVGSGVVMPGCVGPSQARHCGLALAPATSA